jgi:CBS domain-containing protein
LLGCFFEFRVSFFEFANKAPALAGFFLLESAKEGQILLFSPCFPAMEINSPVSGLLGQKGSAVWSIAPETTVFDAIQMMSEKNVGALPVMRGTEVLGMFSERDYTRKIALKGRSSKETTIGDVMSSPPLTVAPNDSVDRCMRLMTQSRIRHLPVVQDGQLIGIVSIGDLVNWIISTQSATIAQLEQYIHGGYSA